MMDSSWLSPVSVLETFQALALDDHTRHKRYVVTQGLMDQSRVVAALFIIFIILIFIFNVFLIVVILMSKAMRSSSRHLLIINVCVADLIMGIFVLPVLLNLGLRSDEVEDTKSDCSTFHAMRIFADFLIPSVTTLAILALNIDYILRLCCNAYSEGASRIAMMIGLFAMPWLLSCSILIPIYTQGLNTKETNIVGRLDAGCSYGLDPSSTRSLLLVSFFVQALLLLVFNIIVSIMYLFNRESFGLDVCGERIRAPVDICLASFTTLVLYTPIFLIVLLSTEHYISCDDPSECSALDDLNTCAIWAMFTKSWILCFSWFTCRDTRACVGHVIRC